MLVLEQESESEEVDGWTLGACFSINRALKGQTAEQECAQPSLLWLAMSKTERLGTSSLDTKCPHFHFKW